MINGNQNLRFNDPMDKLSNPGDINLKNLYNNFNIKLHKNNGGLEGFIDNHPYLSDTVKGVVSGTTMLLNNQYQNELKKKQRDYFNDPFNLYQTSTMKKYGSYPWLTSTGQFTDFPNEKVPVYEPGYENSAYTNTMAKAKTGGQLFMAFQDGGATNQFGQGQSLPKYEMGAGSPVQNAMKSDSSHYGIPMAQKGGGFFTPEKLTDNTENYEYYEKPNNFLNYLKDMSANAVLQKALGRTRRGQLEDTNEMGMAQMGNGMSGGDFEEFGFKGQNPLNPYYTDMYDPSEANQANAELIKGLYTASKQAFRQPMDIVRGKQAQAQAQLNALNQPQQAQVGTIVKPTATDAAGFENWYNETMGHLLADQNTTQADITAFMNMAGNWANDLKIDRNQLQSKAQNPLTYQVPSGALDLSGNPIMDILHRQTRDNQDKYQQEYLDILKKFDSDYDVAAANNQIASSTNPNANPSILKNLEAERDKAISTLEKKYPNKPSTDQDFFYTKPGAATSANTPGTTTPGTTITNTTPNAGGYQFNPAMQQLLAAMAQGYTKAPLFGFRTNRNINAMFNQTMAEQLLGMQGQGQGTAGTNGTTVPSTPAIGPGANTYNTWIKDNNINRYDVKQGPNRFKMKIRANQPGQALAQVDANGNPIPQNANPGFLDRIKGLYDKSNVRPNQMEREVKRTNKKIMGELEAEKAYRQNPNSYSPLQTETPYNILEPMVPPGTGPLIPKQSGGQYQQGGTYMLSDEEIQALLDAGYELE